MSRRSYDNSQRAASARATRARILAAAYHLLVEHGYAALSIARLAQTADVSPQTIYNSIGGKADVLKACYDVTLAGDDEPVPMAERPQYRALSETTSAEAFLDRYAAWCRMIWQRIEKLIAALVRPGAGDTGLAAFLETTDEERRVGTMYTIVRLKDLHGIRRGLPLQRAVDVAWTLNSPEVYDRLVNRCGWSSTAYERWLAGQLKAALL